MALVPWSPLKNGFLSGKYRRGGDVVDSARAAFVGGPSDDEFDVIDAVAAIADELGTTSAAVALAWLRARPGTVVPIIGARRLDHLEAQPGRAGGRAGPRPAQSARPGFGSGAELSGGAQR